MTAYQALYRRYRPQRFAEVAGQDHIVRTLQNALRQKRYAHAYLFTGPRGTGKTSMARLLAKAINCLEPDAETAEPCNACEICRDIQAGTALDVIEIDAASNRGIDEIRDLRDQIHYVPGKCKNKVYIIDEVHMLTEPAFNALLKTLEDPPERVVFILATTDVQKVPVTIISRCQRFDFHRVPLPEIVRHLQRVCEQEQIDAEPEALLKIARQARGGLRDALSLLDQASGLSPDRAVRLDALLTLLGGSDEDALQALTGDALRGDLMAGLARIREWLDAGRDPRQCLQDWLEYLRHLLILSFGEQGAALVPVTAEQREALLRQAAAVDRRRLLDLLEYVADREQAMRWLPDGQLVLETAFIRAVSMLAPAGSAGSRTVPAGTEAATEESATVPAAGAGAATAAPEAGKPSDVPAGARVATRSSPASGKPAAIAKQPAGVRPQGSAKPVKPATSKPATSKPPAAGAQAAAPALEQLVAEWPAFIAAVKRKNPIVSAYLEPSAPVAFSGGVLEIGFPEGNKFHADRAGSADSTQLIAAVFKQRYGIAPVIRCSLGTAPPASAGAEQALPEPPAGASSQEPPPAEAPLPEPPPADVPLPELPPSQSPPAAPAQASEHAGKDAPPYARKKPRLQGQDLVADAFELFGGEFVELKEE